jgi:adenylosuccinate synthase
MAIIIIIHLNYIERLGYNAFGFSSYRRSGKGEADMAFTAVVGTQWGDEGKGRIVDYLAGEASMVIRYQGGNNAGHTVVNEHGTFKLHLIPSGIFRQGVICLLGPGMVIAPAALLSEMDELAVAGIDISGLKISERAHLVMPYHIALDKADEAARKMGKIGSTLKGIAWAYADKSLRVGLRAGDLRDAASLKEKVLKGVELHNRWITQLYGREALDPAAIVEELLTAAARLKDIVVDSVPLIRHARLENDSVLLEGQLGMMRDLDWGDYPFVTSSSPVPGGASVGAGIPPQEIKRSVGVVKAYTTSVGEGPLPTELLDDSGAALRDIGVEFGATTGRPRRCGWFDVLPVRRSVEVGGVTELALTKLDVMDSFPSVKICVAYEKDGKRTEELPFNLEGWKPVYEEMPGWRKPTRDARRWEDLPKEARAYVERIEELSGAPITVVSVGPGREELLLR